MKIVVVAGATASGKTNLAVHIAAHLKGEIISADSRQVYKGMNLGTGKDLFEFTTPQGVIPHHLIDTTSPSDIYSLYHFQRDCYGALSSIDKQNKVPIICGGTGLYIESVLQQYHIANVPEMVSFRVEQMQRELTQLTDLLKESNSELYHSTDLKSKKRVVRSLEICEYAKSQKVPYSDDFALPISPCIIVPLFERATLLERIDTRLHTRLEEGMVQEVQGLLDSGVTDERMMVLGLEYREITNYLLGRQSYTVMVESLRTAIHRFSKRQMTWFRGMERRGLQVHWLKEGDKEEALEVAQRFLARDLS